jgi:hypothetical protein
MNLANRFELAAGDNRLTAPKARSGDYAQVLITAVSRCGAGDQHSVGLTEYYRSLILP